MRWANSTVRSASSSAGKILLTMPSAWASSASMASPVSSSSLALRGPNSHGWAKYSTPHMPRREPTTSAKRVSSAHTMRSHAHSSISDGGVDLAVGLADGDLAQVAPAAGVLEEVVPLLEHQALGALAGAAVDRPGRVLVRARAVLLHRRPSSPGRGRRRTSGPSPPRMTTRTSSSASARRKASLSSTSMPRFWALRASGRFSMIRAICPSDEGLVQDELVVGHLRLPRARLRAPSARRAAVRWPMTLALDFRAVGIQAPGGGSPPTRCPSEIQGDPRFREAASRSEAAQRRVRRAGHRRAGARPPRSSSAVAARRCSTTARSPTAGATLDPSLGDGPLLGKRYADEELGLELLCNRAGDGRADRRRPAAPGEGRQAAAVVGLTPGA